MEEECVELAQKQIELKEIYDGYNTGVSEYIIRKQNIENIETNHKSDQIFQQRRLRTLKHDVQQLKIDLVRKENELKSIE